MQTITRNFYGLNFMATLQGHFHRHFTCNFFAINIAKKISKDFVVKKKHHIFAALEPAKPLNDAQMCGSFYLTINFYNNAKKNPISEAIRQCTRPCAAFKITRHDNHQHL